MTHVYIWDWSSRSACGHASMLCASTYISWWPNLSLLGPGDLPRGIRGLFPADRLEDDVRAEGKWPDQTFAIPNLDEDEVLRWWSVVMDGSAANEGWYNKPCSRSFFWNSVRLVDLALQKGSSDLLADRGITEDALEKVFTRPPAHGGRWEPDLRCTAYALRRELESRLETSPMNCLRQALYSQALV